MNLNLNKIIRKIIDIHKETKHFQIKKKNKKIMISIRSVIQKIQKVDFLNKSI